MDIKEVLDLANNTPFYLLGPLIRFAILVITAYYILGKDLFFGKKTPKQGKKEIYEGKPYELKNGIYVLSPHQDKQENKFCFSEFIKKHGTALTGILLILVIFITEIISDFLADINLFSLTYSKDTLLAFSVSETVVAHIWSYTPETPFTELPDYIDSLAYVLNYPNRTVSIYMILLGAFRLTILFSIVCLLISLHKKRKDVRKRCFIVFVISVPLLLCLHIGNIYAFCGHYEDKCNQVANHLFSSSELSKEDLFKCYEKLDEEKELLKDKKIFSINISFDGISERVDDTSAIFSKSEFQIR